MSAILSVWSNHVCPMKEPTKIRADEITQPTVYFNRRMFIRAGILAASAVATGLVYRRLNPVWPRARLTRP
jgi:hypothetical protein